MALPASKFTVPIEGISGSTGTTIFGYVDAVGFDFMSIDILLTDNGADSDTPTVFKLGESTTTDLTNATDITKFVGDGVGGWTIPVSVASNAASLWKFDVDTRPYERYLFLEIVPRTALTCWAFANVHRGERQPATIAEAGVVALVQG